MTLVAIALASNVASAFTDVTGDITSTETWKENGSPYIIKASVVVQDGVTLTIREGVDVKFGDGFFLDCTGSGRIVARGTADKRINFTSNSANPLTGDWEYVSTGVGGSFYNCTIKYARTCLYAETGSTVIDCTFASGSVGAWVRGNGAYVSLCKAWATTLGFIASNATSSKIVDCIAENGQRGFEMAYATASTTFLRCEVVNNVMRGFEYSAGGADNLIQDGRTTLTPQGMLISTLAAPGSGRLQVFNCTFIGCGAAGISLSSVTPVNPIILKRCRIYNSFIGIDVSISSNIEMTECTFKDNTKGTRLQECTGYSIYIHKNNFIKNTQFEAETVNSEAHYDKNGYGNYWWRAIYEYGFKDENDDGIADTPWSLTVATQKDNYPLMTPVDFLEPMADAGPDIEEKQHRSFKLDGSRSFDDTWIVNYTWAIELPGGDQYAYGENPSVIVRVAGVFPVTLKVTDPLGHIDYDTAMMNITDAEAPTISAEPTPKVVGAGTWMTFGAIVEDNTAIDIVWVSYKFGLGSTYDRIDMVHKGGDLYEAELWVPLAQIQSLFYRILALDLERNQGRTGEIEVPVDDVTPPMLTPDDEYDITTGDRVWLNVTIKDNRQVANATVEFWFGDGEHEVLNMSMMGVRWIVQVDVPREGPSPLNVIFTATDKRGNVNFTNVVELEVVDNDPPVKNLDSTTTKLYKGEKALVQVVLSDNIEIDKAYVEVRYPPESTYEATPLELNPLTGAYEGEINVSRTGVRIYYRFRVIDISGNVLLTEDEERMMLSQRPSIVTQPPVEAYEGQLYSVDFDADDPDNLAYELTWTMETNATWLLIDPSEGIVSGTPEDYHVGVYWVNVTVMDPDRVSDSLEFTITVLDVNAPPVVSITFPQDGQKVGTTFKVSGTTTDDLGVILWVKVSVDGGEWMDATGTAVWTFEMPVKGLEPGTHYVEVKASDGVTESIIAEISFTVPKPESDDEGPGFGSGIALIALFAAVGTAALLSRRRD